MARLAPNTSDVVTAVAAGVCVAVVESALELATDVITKCAPAAVCTTRPMPPISDWMHWTRLVAGGPGCSCRVSPPPRGAAGERGEKRDEGSFHVTVRLNDLECLRISLGRLTFCLKFF